MESHIIKWFARGISEDDTIWGSQSVLDVQNIDIYSHANKVKLAKDATISCNTTELPQQAIAITNWVTNQTYNYFFCNSWEVYRDWDDTPVFSWVLTSHLNKHLFQLWDYVYFTTSNWPSSPMQMNRILNTDTSWSWNSNVDTNISLVGDVMPDTWYAEGYPVTISNWVAYMWIWNYIAKMYYDTAWLENLETFFVWNEVIGLSATWWNIYIYYKDWKIDIWNWLDLIWLYPWSDLGFRVARIKQIWNTVWGIAWFLGNDQELFYMNWLTPEVIYTKSYSNVLERNKFDINYDSNINSLTYWKWVLYWIDDTLWHSSIFALWKTIKGQPSGYSLPHTLSTDSFTYARLVSYEQWELFVWYSNSTFKGVKKISPDNDYITEWEITTLVDNLGNDLYDKIINSLYFRVEDITATEYIEVYAWVDWWAYTLVETINEQPKNNQVAINLVKKELWLTERLSLKFKLFWSWSATPILFNTLLIKYENSNVK